MGEKFTRDFEVGAKALTPSLLLAPSDVFDLLQETATVHSDFLGYSMEYFVREQKGWALLNWHAEFERLPKWRERLTVETWPTSGKGLVANRNFRVLDANGVSIMKAVSQWIFFDNVRRRPIKISGEMLSAYTTDLDNLLPIDKLKIDIPADGRKIGGSTLTVRRSSTDSNFHVNNVAYIKWAEDELPDDVFRRGNIKTVLVNYRKEAKNGDEIVTAAYESENNLYTCYLSDREGNTFVEVSMKYQ